MTWHHNRAPANRAAGVSSYVFMFLDAFRAGVRLFAKEEATSDIPLGSNTDKGEEHKATYNSLDSRMD